MALADNVAEIIRIDRLIEEMAAKPVIALADLTTYRWLKQQWAYQVRAIRNYEPPSQSIR